jgi:phage tail-like protein
MMQQSLDSQPFVNMRFRIEIDGLHGVGASDVTLPEARMVNTSAGRSTAQFGPLIICRGASQSSEWYEWWSAARRAQSSSRRNVVVTLLDAAGQELNRWWIRDARPIAYRLSGLHALGNEVLMETLELSVGDFGAGSRPIAERRKTPVRKSRRAKRASHKAGAQVSGVAR